MQIVSNFLSLHITWRYSYAFMVPSVCQSNFDLVHIRETKPFLSEFSPDLADMLNMTRG